MRLTACTHGLRLHSVCDNANMSTSAATAITAVCKAQNITLNSHRSGFRHAHLLHHVTHRGRESRISGRGDTPGLLTPCRLHGRAPQAPTVVPTLAPTVVVFELVGRAPQAPAVAPTLAPTVVPTLALAGHRVSRYGREQAPSRPPSHVMNSKPAYKQVSGRTVSHDSHHYFKLPTTNHRNFITKSPVTYR